ncbi:MAG: glycosyltransferase, partial [Gammaproteobacteria bacterium]|nr:glycosyltransferase [Gammaproteobacteria bacterium]
MMPAYNVEPFVADAVESVLRQTVRDLELIVVDDGSTDRTPEILGRYEGESSRVRVVSGAHNGVSAALNLGVAHAE